MTNNLVYLPVVMIIPRTGFVGLAIRGMGATLSLVSNTGVPKYNPLCFLTTPKIIKCPV